MRANQMLRRVRGELALERGRRIRAEDRTLEHKESIDGLLDTLNDTRARVAALEHDSQPAGDPAGDGGLSD
jgi:hypothetical protein